MFRKPLGRPFRRAVAGNIPPALQRANRLMAEGQYVQAAEIFEQFATAAARRNGPRAPWFYLQAGRARLLADQIPEAVPHFKRGLAFFAQRGQFQKLYHAGMRSVTQLKARGHADEAAQIEAYLKAVLPAGFGPTAMPASPAKLVLPTTCPGCGGPILSDEVDWADEVTAECPYCGSAVRAT